ncbi:nuclear transport factor 2 family protein [Streptomyces sp. NPDC048279]|uniref:nuclear transport factor 2 family protein n=1 Tax=Streptomyces sp. NPDC048279 TaxID=3154714 RepID=UPI0034345821
MVTTAALGTTASAAQPAGRHLPRVVTDWSAAWNGADPDALGSLSAADGTCTDQGIGVTFHGRQEIAGWKARTDSLIGNVHVTVRAACRDGHRIAGDQDFYSLGAVPAQSGPPADWAPPTPRPLRRAPRDRNCGLHHGVRGLVLVRSPGARYPPPLPAVLGP